MAPLFGWSLEPRLFRFFMLAEGIFFKFLICLRVSHRKYLHGLSGF